MVKNIFDAGAAGMDRQIGGVLDALAIQPVLLDIGASGAPPALWEPIASRSVYVGFDPDRRKMCDHAGGKYARSIIMNEAVTGQPGEESVRFYLTESPYCSSTLEPDAAALGHYIFSGLFAVKGDVRVRALTVNAVIGRLGLPGVDWFKSDSQGTDLRLFQSIGDDLRSRVLAVDIEPGLADAYKGEGLFVDAHSALVCQGFWLSSREVKGSARMKRATMQTIAHRRPFLTGEDVERSVCPSPV